MPSYKHTHTDRGMQKNKNAFFLFAYQKKKKKAFLQGDLVEEVYMEQPPKFVAQGESGLVCKLRHSLYDPKQSP